MRLLLLWFSWNAGHVSLWLDDMRLKLDPDGELWAQRAEIERMLRRMG